MLVFGVRVLHTIVDASDYVTLANLVHVKSSHTQTSYVSTTWSSAKSVALGCDKDGSVVDGKSPSAEYTVNDLLIYTHLNRLSVAPPSRTSV